MLAAMAYDPNNIFAKILRGEMPACRVHENNETLVIMDAMPQAAGHVLVLPRTPAQDIFDLEPAMAAAVMRTAQQAAHAVRAAFTADGVTLMQFNGAAGGQTVFHFHLHVIPRHAGIALQGHARHMAEMAVLEEQAARIRAAWLA